MGYGAWNASQRELFVTLGVGGEELSATILQRVTAITVKGEQGKAQQASVSFRDEKLELIDLDIFAKHTEWAVKVGFLDGEVVPLGPYYLVGYKMDFGDDGVCVIDVDLQDSSAKLMRKSKSRAWTGKNLGDVVQALAEEHGLGYRIDASAYVTFSDDAPLMQAGVSDAQLLRKLAERFGFHLGFDQGVLHFTQTETAPDMEDTYRTYAWRIGPRSLRRFTPKQHSYMSGKGTASPKIGPSAQPGADIEGGNVDIEAGESFDFAAASQELVAAMAGGEKEAQEGGAVTAGKDAESSSLSWVMDPVSMTFVEKVTSPDKPTASAKDTGADTPQTSAQAVTAAAAAKAGGKGDVADATGELTIPDPTVRVGDPCEIVGVGLRFSGRWRIVGFTHTYSPKQGLKTQLSFGKKGLGASSKTAAAEDKTVTEGAATDTGVNDPVVERVWGMSGTTMDFTPGTREKK